MRRFYRRQAKRDREAAKQRKRGRRVVCFAVTDETSTGTLYGLYVDTRKKYRA